MSWHDNLRSTIGVAPFPMTASLRYELETVVSEKAFCLPRREAFRLRSHLRSDFANDCVRVEIDRVLLQVELYRFLHISQGLGLRLPRRRTSGQLRAPDCPITGFRILF